jgi:C4-dicarboxylate-specific signal transduction histidine kinase
VLSNFAVRGALHDLRNYLAVSFGELELCEKDFARGHFENALARVRRVKVVQLDGCKLIDSVAPIVHGQGLGIVSQAASSMGAKLKIESFPNKGAKITLKFAKAAAPMIGQQFDLAACVVRFAGLITDQLKMLGIELKLNICELQLHACGDMMHTQRILQNLCINSRDAIVRAKRIKGEIVLTVHADEAFAILSVLDNGTGFQFAAEQFEPQVA